MHINDKFDDVSDENIKVWLSHIKTDAILTPRIEILFSYIHLYINTIYI